MAQITYKYKPGDFIYFIKTDEVFSGKCTQIKIKITDGEIKAYHVLTEKNGELIADEDKIYDTVVAALCALSGIVSENELVCENEDISSFLIDYVYTIDQNVFVIINNQIKKAVLKQVNITVKENTSGDIDQIKQYLVAIDNSKTLIMIPEDKIFWDINPALCALGSYLAPTTTIPYCEPTPTPTVSPTATASPTPTNATVPSPSATPTPTPTPSLVSNPISTIFNSLYSQSFTLDSARDAKSQIAGGVLEKSQNIMTGGFVDPVFDTNIRQTTSVDDVVDSITGIRHEYSRRQAWNCDSTFFLAQASNGFWYYYDANTLVRQDGGRNVPYSPGMGAITGMAGDCEPIWHPTDPNKIWHTIQNGGLEWFERDLSTQTTTTLFNLTQPLSQTAITNYERAWFKGEGRPSNDGRWWALQVEDGGYNIRGLIMYDRLNNTIVGHKVLTSNRPDHISTSPNGNFAVPSWYGNAELSLAAGNAKALENFSGVRAYSRDFSTFQTISVLGQHSDLALDAYGNEVYVGVSFHGDRDEVIDGSIFVRRLDNPAVAYSLPINGYQGSTGSGFHISGCAFRRPGWVVVSKYEGVGIGPFDNQVVVAELVHTNQRVYRLAHHRSTVSEYFSEPHATANSDLTRVVYASDNEGISPYAEDYQILLPSWAIPTTHAPQPPDPSPTPTPSVTASITPSGTAAATVTPTPTVTPTQTRTPTPTVTPTGTISVTPTSTVTPTMTQTGTPAITPTPSPAPQDLWASWSTTDKTSSAIISSLNTVMKMETFTGVNALVRSNSPITGNRFFEIEVYPDGQTSGYVMAAGVSASDFVLSDDATFGENNLSVVALCHPQGYGQAIAYAGGSWIHFMDNAGGSPTRVMIAVKSSTREVWLGVYGVGYFNNGNPATGANPTYTIGGTAPLYACAYDADTATWPTKYHALITNPASIIGTVPSGFIAGIPKV